MSIGARFKLEAKSSTRTHCTLSAICDLTLLIKETKPPMYLVFSHAHNRQLLKKSNGVKKFLGGGVRQDARKYGVSVLTKA